jgi:hypothetical protein
VNITTSFQVFDDDHWLEPETHDPKNDPFYDLEDPFENNSSTIISSTINDNTINSSSGSNSSLGNSISLEAQLNKLSLDSNAWQLTRTNVNSHKKKGYKLSSLGYSYTVDKPKIEDIPTVY